MKPMRLILAVVVLSGPGAALPAQAAADVTVDIAGHKAASGIAIRQDGTKLHVRWPMAEGEQGVFVLQLAAKQPLIEELGIARRANGVSA